MKNKDDFKIDLVYTWVDGSDPKWLEKKKQYLSELKEEIADFPCRFIDNDELKYSLRSVEKYASWINHIYIITDEQVPVWLNTDNPKITIVDHKEIMPSEVLPTFNSLAVEYCMHKIPNLSEYFLYANDDYYFADYVTPDFFFRKDKKFYCRFEKLIKNATPSHFLNKINNSVNLLHKKGYKFPLYITHHNIDSFRKSFIEKCQKEFGDEIYKTIKSRFRSSEHLQRSLYQYYAIAINEGVFIKVQEYSQLMPWFKRLIAKIKKKKFCKDSLFIYLNPSKAKGRVKKHHPKLLCINDGEATTDEDRVAIKKFLEEYFPEKSAFEK